MLSVFVLLLIFINCVRGGEVDLRVTGIGGSPYLKLGERIEGSTIPGGVDLEVLRIVTSKMKLEFAFQISDGWGSLVNGTWTGTIGKVHRREADLGLGHLATNHVRNQVVDLSCPLYTFEQVIIVRKPRPLPKHFNLTRPFTWGIWLGMILVLLAVICIFTLILKGCNERSMTTSDIALTIIGMMVTQSQLERLRSWRLRMVAVVLPWLMLTSILIWAYGSNLRASLVAQDFEKAINTVCDLTDSKIHVFIPRGTTLDYLFKSAPNTCYKRVYADISKNGQYYTFRGATPDWMLDKMLKEKVALVGSRVLQLAAVPAIKARLGHYPFRQGQQVVFNMYCGFAYRKHWHLAADFNDHIIHLVAGGIVNKIISDNLGYRNLDEDTSTSEEFKIDFDHMLLPNLFWVISINMAALILFVEIRVARNQQQG